MMKFFRLFTLSFLLYITSSHAVSLKERFENAKVGSYIATEIQSVVSLLRIHGIEDGRLYLEEINVPSNSVQLKKINWNEWIERKAPGCSSWLLYEIDMTHGKITDCYSFDQKNYIHLGNQQSFLTTLMFLKLNEISDMDRKKIGPKPQDLSSDTRKVWNPPKIVHGKKIKGIQFDAMRTSWPKDGSDLSLKTIDLYFDPTEKDFPFPYWIEVGDTQNVFKIRVIDSGVCESSPCHKMPGKALDVSKISLDSENGLDISLNNAYRFKEFQLLATQSSGHCFETLVLPHEVKVENTLVQLHTPAKTLKTHLKENTYYHFVIVPVEEPRLAAEPRQSFVWR